MNEKISHGCKAANRCADHAAALGALGLVSLACSKVQGQPTFTQIEHRPKTSAIAFGSSR